MNWFTARPRSLPTLNVLKALSIYAGNSRWPSDA